MRTFLHKLMVDITRQPREIIEPVWSPNLWTHNVFRVYEYIFGRRAGIRPSGYATIDGVEYSYSWEHLIAVYEGVIRTAIKRTLPKFSIVYVPQLQLAGMAQGGVSPFRFAIAFDATSSLDGAGSHFTTFTYNATCTGTGLTLTINTTANEVGAPTISSMSFNSVACTGVNSVIFGNSGTYQWYQAGPSTGTHTLSITLNKSGLISSGCMSFTGTNTVPLGAFNTNNNSSSTTSSVTLTTTSANSWIADCLFVSAGKSTVIPVVTGTNQTSRFVNDAFGVNNQLIAGSSQTTTSAGSYTTSWSFSGGNQFWQEMVLEVISGAGAVVNSGFFFAAAS